MDIISGLTDDQKALLGCFVALVTCAAIMSLTSLLRRERYTAVDDEAAEQTNVSLPAQVHVKRATPGEKSHRKAA
jgi:hypothetical protein